MNATGTGRLPSIHLALRRGTAASHARLDEVVDASEPFASRGAYTALLLRHLDARRALVRRYGGLAPPGQWAQRADTVQAALLDDLQRLGRPQPPPAPEPGIDGPAGLGLLYVLEGSLLGGRLLAQRVTSALGGSAPCAFLTAGAAPAGRWPEALRLLERHRAHTAAVLEVAAEAFGIYLSVFDGPA